MRQYRLWGILFALGMAIGFGAYLSYSRIEAPPPASPAEPSAPQWFEDVSSEVGLDFAHEAGPVGDYFFPQIMGSGGGFLDFDSDGRLDLYLIQNGGPASQASNRLYHQEPDGRFRDVSAGSGLDVAGHGMGLAVGDVNNDGLVDVVLTEYGGLRLFRNRGHGRFTAVTREAGLDNPLWGTSAAFLDFDADGWLDLVVVNYVDYDPSIVCRNASGKREYCHPRAFKGTVSKLYHNLGGRTDSEPGTIRFADQTLASGLGKQTGPALGVYCADFTGDGRPDIFVANDSKPNFLWVNQGDGTFQEQAIMRGLAHNRMGNAEANMGVAIGDVDGDGLFDLFITHLTEETHTLWKQGPPGLFRDLTVASGITSAHWRGTGFGTTLADFDHDGVLDLAVVNGRVTQSRLASPEASAGFWTRYQERNQLFAGQGQAEFRDLSLQNPAFCGEPAVARGLACGDYDDDGDLDLLVTVIAGPARLYRNVAPKQGHWLQVRAIDPALQRDAYGAEVTVHAAGRRWVSTINPGYSYLCSNDARAHFGLGPADSYERLEVLWPGGAKETFPGGPADRLVPIGKGEGLK